MSPNDAITNVWPRARMLLELVLNRAEEGVMPLLDPGGSAAAYFDMHGMIALELLLKTIFGRTQVGLAQAIVEPDEVLFEYVWLDPVRGAEAYEPEEVACVRMSRMNDSWRVRDVNPTSLDHWLTSKTARGMLAQKRDENDGELPQSADILPIAFLAGLMKAPILAGAMRDDVERLLLPTLQRQQFGALALVKARAMWGDFVRLKTPRINENTSKLWAAALTVLIAEQADVELTQAASAELYEVPFSRIFSAIRAVRTALEINGKDERYQIN